ncbi:MAG: bifunctional molybdenum cofactor biosynthesis protein MoaC/MoaB [Deltaproteobacteria bacterium]|nr:MAG: bifunctional molybdenum cofactor biosynthesis protein MoaC/MoaB [Deltaproteobacteria bacterium]
MIDVSDKLNSLREATASASITAREETIEAVRSGQVPKGNVVEVARTAGILAAKKTSELIPLCHPVPLDFISVDFEFMGGEIVIKTRVKAIWKTGVEMEALCAASVAALTVYDMLKPLDDSLEIKSVRLIEKRGGKGDWKESFTPPLRAAVLVFSDSVSQGKKEDRAGKTIVEKLKKEPVEVTEYRIFPDDFDIVRRELIRLSDEEKVDLVITTGGTGLSPRDVTVDATKTVIEREVPGIPEAARIYGFQRTPYAMLSREIAGVRGKTLIINLPGSSRGASESMDALFPWVLHAFWILRGGGHKEKKKD